MTKIEAQPQQAPESNTGGAWLNWAIVVVTWLIAAPASGLFILGLYGLKAFSGYPCSYGYLGRNSTGSEVTATILGGLLWLAGGFAAWRFRGERRLLFAGYAVLLFVLAAALYIVSLVALWYASPLIWGSTYC